MKLQMYFPVVSDIILTTLYVSYLILSKQLQNLGIDCSIRVRQE